MYESVIGGGAGGIAALATSPLEIIKTRIQSNQHGMALLARTGSHNPLSMCWRGMQVIVRNEGIKSLWKGATPTILGSIPSRAIFFGVQAQSLKHFEDLPSDTKTLLSSFLGGIVSTTATSPIWMIKTRMQLNDQVGPTSIALTLKDILRKEGVKYLWKGIGASWLGVFETSTQWLFLERLKRSQDSSPIPLNSFSCAAIAKLAATTLWYPHEVIRTRMREKNNTYTNMFNCFLRIARSESVTALYSGLGIQLLRVVPNFALTVYLYDLLLKGTSR